jgi:hypothetical protein
VQLTYKEEAAPPVEKLIDNYKDNYHQLFSYETIPQLREQDSRRKNECQTQVMSGAIAGDPKAFEACMDAGKRRDSIKDRIYRKYMGIEEVNLAIPADINSAID